MLTKLYQLHKFNYLHNLQHDFYPNDNQILCLCCKTSCC